MKTTLTQTIELNQVSNLTIITEGGQNFTLREDQQGFLILQADRPLFAQWRGNNEVMIGQVNPVEAGSQWSQSDPKIRSIL